MKLIKSLFVGAAMLCVAAYSASAQKVLYAGTINGGTNNVPANSATSYVIPITLTNVVTSNGIPVLTNLTPSTTSLGLATIRNSRIIDFEPEFALNGPGNSNVVFGVSNSVDSKVFNFYTNLTLVSNGTNPVSGNFPIDTANSTFWEVGQIVNNNSSSAVTNIAVPIGSHDGL